MHSIIHLHIHTKKAHGADSGSLRKGNPADILQIAGWKCGKGNRGLRSNFSRISFRRILNSFRIKIKKLLYQIAIEVMQHLPCSPPCVNAVRSGNFRSARLKVWQKIQDPELSVRCSGSVFSHPV